MLVSNVQVLIVQSTHLITSLPFIMKLLLAVFILAQVLIVFMLVQFRNLNYIYQKYKFAVNIFDFKTNSNMCTSCVFLERSSFVNIWIPL